MIDIVPKKVGGESHDRARGTQYKKILPGCSAWSARAASSQSRAPTHSIDSKDRAPYNYNCAAARTRCAERYCPTHSTGQMTAYSHRCRVYRMLSDLQQKVS
jgi:hypothetical protein